MPAAKGKSNQMKKGNFLCHHVPMWGARNGDDSVCVGVLAEKCACVCIRSKSHQTRDRLGKVLISPSRRCSQKPYDCKRL